MNYMCNYTKAYQNSELKLIYSTSRTNYINFENYQWHVTICMRKETTIRTCIIYSLTHASYCRTWLLMGVAQSDNHGVFMSQITVRLQDMFMRVQLDYNGLFMRVQ